VIALLIPGYPRIKEWVYAGFVYDLTGAIYSGLAMGDPVPYGFWEASDLFFGWWEPL